MKILKGVGALLAAVILFFVVVSNFGSKESRFQCPGQVRRTVGDGDNVTTRATLYGRVETYRWFIFWADHDAMITWEIQPGGDSGFGYYDESSFATPITDLQRTKTYGSFSSLSRRIYVETALDGEKVFEGVCE